MDKVTLRTTKKQSSEMNTKRHYYILGYLDGLTEEKLNEINSYYKKGHLEAIKDKHEKSKEELIIIEENLVKQLAKYDVENFVENRTISQKYRNIYQENYLQTKEKIKSRIKKYATKTSLNKDSSKKIQCYSFGYIDGYFKEKMYQEYIPDENIKVYQIGIKEGTLEREKNKKRAENQKEILLIKLAVFDAKNKNSKRNLSKEAEEIYNLHYQDVLNNVDDMPLDEETIKLLDKEIR